MGRKIFLAFSFLMLSLASLYCFWVVTAYALKTDTQNIILTQNDITEYDYNYDYDYEKPLSNVKDSLSSTASAGEITAAANNTAKGKIISKSIDSSSANLKYNKIYVKNNTSIKVDLKTELLTLPNLKIISTNKPQVLIVHTHTTECYMSEERDYYTAADKTRTTNEKENIVAVGKVLGDTLKQKGIGVVHATEKHDYPEYTGSYSRAEQTIKTYLKKYPTIKVVIDLHRDSVSDGNNKTALVTTVNGKKAAQVMLVSGCQDGTVTGFSNWRQNFRLAIRLQQTMEVMYKGLARPILFTPRKYNQHLTEGSLLIECGTEANTLEQAKYSATLLGNALAVTLGNLKEK